jgi:hypothetical protein
MRLCSVLFSAAQAPAPGGMVDFASGNSNLYSGSEFFARWVASCVAPPPEEEPSDTTEKILLGACCCCGQKKRKRHNACCCVGFPKVAAMS